MSPEDRATARRKLDNKLNLLRNTEFVAPPRGWLRAVREALGMTSTQLATRLGVVQSRVVAIEKAEAKGTVTVNTLAKAARAMDCRLVYAIVPRTSLEEMTEKQANKQARKLLKTTSHTMALEAQGLQAEDEAELLRSLTQKLIEQSSSSLWEDE